MRYPPACYQMLASIAQHLPHVRPAQQRGLALWVWGTVLAQSSCQTAVLAALGALGRRATVRHYLREWLYDGADKAAPCRTQVDVEPCFASLLRWIVTWWQGKSLALALDATTCADRATVLALSVLYRSSAIPVAWRMLQGNQPGPWLPAILELLTLVHPAVPPTLTTLVLADRGLWSPRLWQAIRAAGWHPLLRLQRTCIVQPDGGGRQAAWQLVPAPGHAWVGVAWLFADPARRMRATVLVVWDTAQREPWVLVTDLAPGEIGVCWYGLRVWVELGFRALKSVGWQWQRTRRTDPARVARHWLVLAVAMLWTLAYGTRAEDAAAQGVPPARLRHPPPLTRGRPREVSVFRRGWGWLHRHLSHGWLWRRLWLLPEPWAPTPPHIVVMSHAPT